MPTDMTPTVVNHNKKQTNKPLRAKAALNAGKGVLLVGGSSRWVCKKNQSALVHRLPQCTKRVCCIRSCDVTIYHCANSVSLLGPVLFNNLAPCALKLVLHGSPVVALLGFLYTKRSQTQSISNLL